LKGVKYPPRVIARALCLYNLGHSQEETVRRIASEHRVKVPRRTVSDWISGYRSITTFHRLRAAAIERFPAGMLKERRLEHQQEIPVYLTAEEIGYYKSKGFFVTLPESKKPITGHTDVLQARNGFIHLLDYKPKAREIDPVNQLVVYALAFASRAQLPVKVFKCAWFDEKDYFEFFPLQAVKAKSAAASA